MQTVDPRRFVSQAFDKIHEQLSLVRLHVDSLDDPVARRLFESMEFGLLAPMRKLRLHLDIPYDWHEQRSAAKEAVR
ncbi:MAG: hypothetical protein HY913_18950 [Desulfomonile tiedjei]|nr:hypothetical protein [Desulfomonile tiedjei]